jgi:hypothetical protein
MTTMQEMCPIYMAELPLGVNKINVRKIEIPQAGTRRELERRLQGKKA